MGSEDSVWIFDSLVGFLNGPIWQAPVQTFVEEHCYAFETHMKDNESHRKVFEEYRNLVDLMLGSYMEDIGISPQQFEDACNIQHNGNLAKHFDYAVFEQIWAANDYDLFKRMMIQRNLEIQLQTLQLMNQKSKEHQLEASTPSTSKIETEEETADAKDFSLEQFSLPPLKLPDEKGILEEHFIKEPQSDQESGAKNTSDVDNNKLEELEYELKSLTTSKQGNRISSAELKKRQQYLRAQRDKLVALKKAERKKKLVDNVDEEKQVIQRPKSAKAAESLLTGLNADSVERQLQIRKNLAQRLRAELLNKE